MKRFLMIGTCATALMLGASSESHADPVEAVMGMDWYISLFGGYSGAPDTDYDLFQLGVNTYSAEQDWNGGFLIGGALGVKVTESLRAEIEVSYQEIDADDAVYTNPAGVAFPYSGDGQSEAVFLLGNLWYDFDIGVPLMPYIGGGIGVAFVDQDITHTSGFPFGPDGSDESFAFQLGAGLKYYVTESIALEVSYRFRGIVDIDIRSKQPGSAHRNQDLYTHNVLGGITLDLN